MMKRMGTSFVATCALACAADPTFRGVDVSSGQSVIITQCVPAQPALPTRCGPASPDRELGFAGTYLSPQFGIVNLQECSMAKIEGDFHYRSCGCNVKGMIHGDVEGNLMRFEWTEDAPVCGAGWHARGKGQLFYRKPPQADRPPRLFGNHAYSVDIADIRSGSHHTETRDAGVLTAVRLAPGAIDPASDERCP